MMIANAFTCYNHPSGDPTPSKADMQLTSVLQSTARLLGVKFLDHLVLGSPDCEDGRGYVSVTERGECRLANERM